MIIESSHSGLKDGQRWLINLGFGMVLFVVTVSSLAAGVVSGNS